jgi:pimeloyl-ACP methyl ester carboxylesterase
MAVDPGFERRYDTVMARWPVPHHGVDLDSRFGTTHVTVCGAESAPPVVLLPGGRATGAVWYATVAALAPAHRLYAIDTIGDAGRSVASGDPIRSLAAVAAWLDATLDGLGLVSAAFVGHSLGAHYALRYALRTPDRVTRLALLDPTQCFIGNRPSFMIRAIPLFVGRHPDRFRRFATWETRGHGPDPDFLDLWAGRFGAASAAAYPKRPSGAELARLAAPLLVITATASRQHDAARLAAAVRRIPGAEVVEIAGASHFMLPQDVPDRVNPPLAAFLAADVAGNAA